MDCDCVDCDCVDCDCASGNHPIIAAMPSALAMVTAMPVINNVGYNSEAVARLTGAGSGVVVEGMMSLRQSLRAAPPRAIAARSEYSKLNARSIYCLKIISYVTASTADCRRITTLLLQNAQPAVDAEACPSATHDIRCVAP